MTKAGFDWLRIGHNDVKFFVHNKCDEKELAAMLSGLSTKAVCGDGDFSDDLAHIICTRSHTVMYRIKNEVYVIPATVRSAPMALIDNKDGKPILALSFDYPCEMKREDLVEY